MSTPHQSSEPTPADRDRDGRAGPDQASGAVPSTGSGSAHHGPGPVRHRIEQASRPVLEQLAKLPAWLPFLVLLLLLVGGGFLGGPVGWVLVTVAMVFILWLLYLSWPRLTPVERVMRIAVLAVFVAVTVTQILPRG